MFNMICGNNVEVLPIIGKDSVDLVVTDPPYNIGVDYPSYSDDKTSINYLVMIQEIVDLCFHAMKPDSAMYFFIGPTYQGEIIRLLKMTGFRHVNTIIWYNTFGQAQRTKYTPSWTAIHYVVKGNPVFNANAIRIPSARQLLYNDKRANKLGKVPDDTWILHPSQVEFRPDADVWCESRVCGTFKERVGHVTQLPEKVVERIILASSNPDHIVLDPFAGTGTVPLVAHKLGRRGIGIELSESTYNLALERYNAQV